jgi:hypothetical protein
MFAVPIPGSIAKLVALVQRIVLLLVVEEPASASKQWGVVRCPCLLCAIERRCLLRRYCQLEGYWQGPLLEMQLVVRRVEGTKLQAAVRGIDQRGSIQKESQREGKRASNCVSAKWIG